MLMEEISCEIVVRLLFKCLSCYEFLRLLDREIEV